MRKQFVVLPCLLVSACTVGPDYKGPPRVAGDWVARGGFARAGSSDFDNAPGLARWWESLGDPLLTSLIDDALAHSPSIELAEARIREARAKLRQQRTTGLPTLSGSASYIHGELPAGSVGGVGGDSGSTSLDLYNLGGTASWEPDLFGGGRRGNEAARASLERSFADRADAQVSLTAQVAQAYVNLRDVQERIWLNQQSSDLQRHALALTELRFNAGTASALDVKRLRGDLQNTDAQSIPLGAQRDEHLNQLGVLTGRAPGALDASLNVPAPVPLPPSIVAIGDPATLIAHRPDIRSAERALAASNAQIGVETADLFPKLKFMGILGLGGSELRDVIDPDKLTTLLAPMLSWNFLDFGRQKATVRKAEAQRDQSIAEYRKAVLEALQDAETSLARFSNTRQQLAQLIEAERTATESVKLNALRVSAGTSNLVDQLDIKRRRLAASISVAQAKAQLTINYITVQKSLGLGWSATGVEAEHE